MTETPAYPGYATPAFHYVDSIDAHWLVVARPGTIFVGTVRDACAGFTATDPRHHYVGLFPDKQAAGEALVRHAGYEVLR